MNPAQDENTSGNKNAVLLQKISFVASLLSILLGLSVFLGYIFHIQLLKSVQSGFVAMNPATALAFIMGGIVIVILQSEKPRRLVYSIGFSFALILTCAGLIKLAGIIFGQDIYFDHILFSSDLKNVATGFQNRIAPNSAVSMLLIGISCLLLYRGSKYKVANYLSFTAGFIALLAIVGYLYGVKNLIGFSEFIPMALNSAVGYILLCVGALFVRPTKGMMQIVSSNSAGGVLSRQLIPFAIFTPFLVGYILIIGQHANLYTPELGFSFLVIIIIIVFIVLIWRVAIILYKIDQDKQQAYKKIKAEEAKDKTLLSSIGDGIFAIDQKRKITLWNKAAEKLTGWMFDEAIGREYTEVIKFIEEGTRHDATGYIEQVLNTGVAGGMKRYTILVAKDGKEIPVGDSAAPILEAGETQVEGVVVVFRDASEERGLEYAKDEFVSLAAHQLRTPLGIIRWSLEALLKQKSVSVSTKGVLTSILDSDMGLIGSVNNILNVTRINQGKIIYKPQTLQAAKEVETAVSKLTPLAEKQGVTLNITSKEDTSKIEVDPELFSEVLSNVLSNAIKYSKKGGMISISLKDTSQALEITVKDTGIGIPQEDLERVFQKFSRAKNVGKSGAEGTGLGLFIVRQYLSTMKGTIRLESKDGEGTTVYIRLPRVI